MSSSKHLITALALGLALATSLTPDGFAASTPSFDGAIAPDAPAPSARAASAPARAPGVASATHTAATPAVSTVAAPQPASPVVAPVPASDGRLTLRDIDQLARNKVARALRDGDEAGATATGNAKPAAATHAEVPPPVPAVIAPAVVRAPRVDPVNFVGSFTDGNSVHILYEYDGAVYPARLGEKLLNGWIVRKVDGLFVTVAQGKTTRTVAMRGGAAETATPAGNGAPVAVSGPLRDLGAPLPTWIAPSAAQ